MGEICGVITEMLILDKFLESLEKYTAEDVMSFPVLTISPTAFISEAAGIMKGKNVHHLVITHNVPNQPLRPIGVISTRDIINALAGKK